MKRLLFIVALIASVALVGAQVPGFTLPNLTPLTQVVDADVITDTGGDTVLVLLKIPHWEPWGLSVQVTATNATGTTDVDVRFDTSIDGVDFHQVDTEDNVLTANSAEFDDVNGFTGRYLRIRYAGGSGSTQTTSIDAYVYIWRLP